MEYILMIAFQFATFSTVVSSPEECRLLGQLNALHWQETGQIAQAICMQTTEV
jgi:hypothetical protein